MASMCDLADHGACLARPGEMADLFLQSLCHLAHARCHFHDMSILHQAEAGLNKSTLLREVRPASFAVRGSRQGREAESHAGLWNPLHLSSLVSPA